MDMSLDSYTFKNKTEIFYTSIKNHLVYIDRYLHTHLLTNFQAPIK